MSHSIQLNIAPAHRDEELQVHGGAHKTVRPLILESWRRSRLFGLDPDSQPHQDIEDHDLKDYRADHPLALVLPIIEQLLIRHAVGNGLVVAVGDRSGRLLWVDGDKNLRRQAENMAFMEGANWSEQAVGTSAPGTALALGRSIQISQTEHFNRIVHPWSCSAVPVHDRATGTLLGVIDVTGTENAVAPVTLPLLEATVAAVEAELDLHRTRSEVQHTGRGATVIDIAAGNDATDSNSIAPRPIPSGKLLNSLETPVLNVLGRDMGLVQVGATEIELSTRHTEILTLLAWHGGGITAQELSRLIYGNSTSIVTVRAEMVRLRKALAKSAPELTPQSRPYRLNNVLELDAQRLLGFLDRGAHRVGLACYTGPVLPASDAPGIVEIREQINGQLRDSLLTNASVETLLEYARLPQATYDLEVWQTCLRLLPPRSPKRAATVAHLERIEAELS